MTTSSDPAVPPTLRADATALAAVATVLGPSAPHGPTRPYAVLPRPDRPRYVLPTSRGHAAGVTLRPGTTRGGAAARWLVGATLRLGGGRLLPGGLPIADGSDGDPSLRRHLAAVLGTPDLDLAVALGGPRPNRKPVVQVIGADGATRAWAKLGVDAHTDALVAHEAAVLRDHRPGPPVVAPEVVATGDWRGHPLLVLAPLARAEAAEELDLTPGAAQAIAGPITTGPVLDGGWWKDLVARSDDPGVDPDGRLRALLDGLAPALAGRRWPFGRWHGDLAPWNATWAGDQLLAWDWERSSGPVPLGFDLVHNRFQVAMLRGATALADAVALVRWREDTALAVLGYAPDDIGPLVAAYLATLRARYLADARFGALGATGPLATALDGDPTLGGTVPR